MSEETTTNETAEAVEPLGEVAILNNGKPFRLDLGKATDSEEALHQYDVETLFIIEEHNDRAARLNSEYESLKEGASFAKKAYDAAIDDLTNIIKQRREDRGKPQQADLFAGVGIDDPLPIDVKLVDSIDDQSWKSVTLQEMIEKDELNQKVAEILTSNGLDTLGKVTAYTEPNANGWCAKLTDLKGFGEKKLEQWSDACSQFWERRAREQRTRSQDSGAGVEGGGGESGSVKEFPEPVGKYSNANREEPSEEEQASKD